MGKQNLVYAPLGSVRITTTEAVVANRMLKASGAYCDADETPVGITEIAYNSGDEAALIIAGTMMVETSEAVTAGEYLSSAADGKAKSQDAGEACIGQCLVTAGGAGFTVVLIAPQNALVV